ncbi:MAG: hypothetical protein QXW39_09315, partial [Candidatus Bathyarchaeia archaeon]
TISLKWENHIKYSIENMCDTRDSSRGSNLKSEISSYERTTGKSNIPTKDIENILQCSGKEIFTIP